MADAVHNLPPAAQHGDADAPPVTAALVRTTALSLLGAAASVALILVLVNRPEWWMGLLAAVIVTAFSAAVSIPPLTWGLSRGLYQATAACFVAMGVRAAVALGGGILVVKALGYPPAPTLLLLMVLYFAVLAAESYVVATRVWHMRG